MKATSEQKFGLKDISTFKTGQFVLERLAQEHFAHTLRFNMSLPFFKTRNSMPAHASYSAFAYVIKKGEFL
ncbi:hypothetical protein A8F94_06955 [Bacillus sp. FJAT-27225]|nr:hypothetical protein A8F94_06955 [Bacillus sp. FJAT-27225]